MTTTVKIDNLVLVGTSHISTRSSPAIKKAVEEYDPYIIAVELDKNRIVQLMNPDKGSVNYRAAWKVGMTGFLFALLGRWVSKKLGKAVGVEPGVDMKAAVLLAKEKNLPVGLIDQHIQITLRRLSSELTWKERFRFIGDIFRGLFFGKREMKRYGFAKIDLKKIPEDELVVKMIKMVKDRYPSIYKTLIAERNEVMSKRLLNLMKKEPGKNIVAVIGAGHKEGMVKLIRKYLQAEKEKKEKIKT